MELRRWLVSEIVAPTLTLSAFCDTECGSVLQSRVPHLQNCGIANLAIPGHHQSAFTASPIHALPRSYALNAFRESVGTSASGFE